MSRYVALIVTALLVAAPAAARPTPEQQQAKKLYSAGTQHYNLGEYPEAIAAYKEAYRLVANPYFLYNIAQSYRLANDAPQALTFYKSFLNSLPDAPERAEVESHIAKLEESIRAQAAAQNATPTAPVLPTPAEAVARMAPPPPPKPTPPRTLSVSLAPAPEASRPIYKKWWFWVGVGAGVVAAGAATTAAMSGPDAPSSDLGNFPVF